MNRKYTLLELVAAIALLLILCGVMAAGRNLISDAEDPSSVAGDFRKMAAEARRNAMASGRSGMIRFFADPARFGRDGDRKACLLLPSGIEFETVGRMPADGESVVVFYPDGSSSGGKMFFRGSGRVSEIGVSALTGTIEIGEAGDEQK